MVGKIAGIVVGAVLAALVMWISENLVAYVGAPVGIDPSGDPAAYARAMPTPALLGLLLSYLVASFLGGMTAARIGREAWASWAAAALALAWVALTAFAFHPIWFMVAAAASIAAGGWLGGAMGRRESGDADDAYDEPDARPWVAPEPEPEPQPEAQSWPADMPAPEEQPPEPGRPRWTPLPPRRDEE